MGNDERMKGQEKNLHTMYIHIYKNYIIPNRATVVERFRASHNQWHFSSLMLKVEGSNPGGGILFR